MAEDEQGRQDFVKVRGGSKAANPNRATKNPFSHPIQTRQALNYSQCRTSKVLTRRRANRLPTSMFGPSQRFPTMSFCARSAAEVMGKYGWRGMQWELSEPLKLCIE